MGERLSARMQDLGSGVIHMVPPLRGLAAKYITKLTEPNDRLLRWRVATKEPAANSDWCQQPGVEGAGHRDLTTWSNQVFGVSRRALGDAMLSGRPAVAYRALGGAVTMIGTREAWPRGEFLRPMNEQGVPDPNGERV